MNTNTFHEIDIERKRLYMENENSGVHDSVDTHEEGRRMSRRKKAKVEYRKMEEKYNQMLDEEDTSEKSKVGGLGISEKKPIPESQLVDQMSGATDFAINTSLKLEKDEPEFDHDDPTGLEGASFQSRLPFEKLTAKEASSVECLSSTSWMFWSTLVADAPERLSHVETKRRLEFG
jgi:hypothetical protein